MKEIKVIQTPTIQFGHYKPLKRVAAYARVSTKLELQSSSLALQVKHYAKSIIFNPNYIFAGVYADHGKSGTSMKNRDGFKALLKKIYAGHIDLVLVKSLSRFARNTIDALTIIRETRKLGVEFYFEKENISSLDPTIDMIFTMMASFAEAESESLSKNVTWGFQKRAEKGEVSAKRCIGYDKNEDKQLIVNEAHAKIIQTLFKMKLNGASHRELLKYLQSEPITTINNKPFTSTTQVTGILKDIKYLGWVVYGKTYIKKVNNEKITSQNNGDRPKYIIKNHHQAIIDIDTFEAVQNLLASETKPHSSGTAKPNYQKWIYSLMHDKYLYRKVKHPGKPEYDLFENDYKRKPGTPRIYNKTVTHVIRKATIALARNFNALESTFDEKVKERLNMVPLQDKLKNIGENIREYKNQYFLLDKKDKLTQAEINLLLELEELIIQSSIDYVAIEDESLYPINECNKRVTKIKKAIKSIALPMTELPLDAVRETFHEIVIVNPETYILVINATKNELDQAEIKKAVDFHPLLEGSCKAKNNNYHTITWKLVMV